MIVTNCNGLCDFPKPKFKIIRGAQMVFSIITLAITVCSGIYGNNWLTLIFNLPAVAIAVVWIIVSFSVYVSGHLGQALLQTIMDCIIASTVLIMSALTSGLGPATVDYRRGPSPWTGVTLMLNYALAASLYGTFGLGVAVHRKQVALKSQGLLGYGRDGYLCSTLDLPDYKTHVELKKVDSYQTA